MPSAWTAAGGQGRRMADIIGIQIDGSIDRVIAPGCRITPSWNSSWCVQSTDGPALDLPTACG